MLGTHTQRIATLALPAGALAMLAACPSRDVAAVDPLLDREQLTEIPIDVQRDLDLIFVVDDSSSMEPNQASLINNFPRFIEVLGSIEGGLPNVHIGVISTDVGADPTPLDHPFVNPQCQGVGHDGRFIVGPQDSGCPGIDDQWLIDKVDADGNVIQNYDGDLADQFTCMASLGVDGCGLEQPLEALRRALEHPDNQGFFREEAYLGVVILSDEDDCSAHDLNMFGEDPTQPLTDGLGPLDSFRCTEYGVECDPVDCAEYPGDMRCEGVRQNCRPREDSPYMHSPQHYADILAEFKGDPDKVIVANIIGESGPFEVFHEVRNDVLYAKLAASCDTSAGDADPAIRLEAFLNQFPSGQTENTSICDGDLSGPIERIAGRFAAALGSPCVDGQIRDTDPDAAGIQPDCVVSDVSNPGTDDEEEFLIPSCDEGGEPCWYMEPSDSCETPTGLQLVIERGDTSPPPFTTVRARCVADG